MVLSNRASKVVCILASLAVGIVLPTISYAFQYETFDHLKTAAKEFVLKTVPLESGESIEVQVHELDRIELLACTNPIEATLPEDSTKEQITSVKLTCHGEPTWHMFMPVNVTLYTQVLVAKRPIGSKEFITEEDVVLSKYDKSRLFSGYFKDSHDVIGMEAQQMIPMGGLLNKQNIQPPVLVHRNQGVDLIAGNSMVIVTMKGIARTDGRLNETIKAFNPESKRLLDAVVTGPGKAQVLS